MIGISPTFHSLVADLFLKMGIDGSNALFEGKDAFTVSVDDKLSIHLVGTQQGFFNFWCFLGKIPSNASQEMLLRLLAKNSFSGIYPTFSISVDMPTKRLTFWTRQALSELNSEKINKLFDRFLKEAEDIQKLLKLDVTRNKSLNSAMRSLQRRMVLEAN